MNASIFEFSHYKAYLNEKIKSMPSKGRGQKLKMAEFLNCQNTYISQVLNTETNFTFEQGSKLNTFFDHSKEESKYFLLLIHLERAGTDDLKTFYQNEIDELIIKNSDLKKRTNVKASLKTVDQEIYYSSWIYSAVHILVTIKEFQSAGAIAKKLNLSKDKILDVLEFLTSTGLVAKTGNSYSIGVTRIHLSKDSPHIQRHHSNWRMKALQAIDANDPRNLHFSNVVSISEKDIVKVREIFIKAIDEARKIVKDSPEEKLQSICVDFFEV